jgi:beta-glucosidase/6-phospho-beta-glucosidase/beta-galactosidase
MSISWPRIIPRGVSGSPVNRAGIRWYRRFIQALLQAGIKPAVTL